MDGLNMKIMHRLDKWDDFGNYNVKTFERQDQAQPQELHGGELEGKVMLEPAAAMERKEWTRVDLMFAI
jgi:hypothetical protein